MSSSSLANEKNLVESATSKMNTAIRNSNLVEASLHGWETKKKIENSNLASIDYIPLNPLEVYEQRIHQMNQCVHITIPFDVLLSNCFSYSATCKKWFLHLPLKSHFVYPQTSITAQILFTPFPSKPFFFLPFALPRP